jgi:hypothetical protein
MPGKAGNPSNTGWRSYGPGKFESMVDSFLWGEGEEDIGDVQGPGYFILITGDLVKYAEDGAAEQGEELNEDERAELAESKGVIMSEDSQGLVGATYYDTEAQARKEWKAVQKEVGEFYEDDESED